MSERRYGAATTAECPKFGHMWAGYDALAPR